MHGCLYAYVCMCTDRSIDSETHRKIERHTMNAYTHTPTHKQIDRDIEYIHVTVGMNNKGYV